MQRICIYTGSNVGNRPEYQEAARAMGQELLERNLGLVYGGGRAGLMGIIADTVYRGGGEVHGVMPTGLFPREIANPQVTELHEVGSMHERKAKMAELADGFVALPGGFGTFDELFEIITWAQLGIHNKPIGLLNVNGYYDPLLALIHHTVQEGFVKSEHEQLLLTHDSPAQLLDKLAAYKAPATHEGKWRDLPQP